MDFACYKVAQQGKASAQSAHAHRRGGHMYCHARATAEPTESHTETLLCRDHKCS